MLLLTWRVWSHRNKQDFPHVASPPFRSSQHFPLQQPWGMRMSYSPPSSLHFVTGIPKGQQWQGREDEGREQGWRERWDARGDSGPTHQDVIVTINIQAGMEEPGAQGISQTEEWQKHNDRGTSCGFGSPAVPYHFTYCASLFTGPGIYSGHCGLGALGGGKKRVAFSRDQGCSQASLSACQAPRLPSLLSSSWASREIFQTTLRYCTVTPKGSKGGKGRIMWGFG